MRTLALLVVLGSSLLACAGEIAPEASGQTASQQRADDAEQEQEQEPAKSIDEGAAKADDFPAPTWGLSRGGCLLNEGPDAPGECTVGTERDCPEGFERGFGSSGGPGFCKQKCVNVSGEARWSEPTRDGLYCPYFDTNLNAGKCACNTPLVLSFDGAAVDFATNATGSFDLSRDGVCHGGDWPTAVTPWLALDRDGNGSIDSGAELFGSATKLGNGSFARNGFDALRDLDDNEDGVLDAKDAAFAKIVVWSDRNMDRLSTPNELTSLAEAGVKAIDLHDRREMRCDARGNCEGERSRFTMTDGRRGTVIDVYLVQR
ncbi:MAG: calcium-binding protein [Labilithrix sp.]|nr:calcium-binding protein [Labilithrix sp.]MCW5818054.1 calcium-binding protein [Labilithrix sp.]